MYINVFLDVFYVFVLLFVEVFVWICLLIILINGDYINIFCIYVNCFYFEIEICQLGQKSLLQCYICCDYEMGLFLE